MISSSSLVRPKLAIRCYSNCPFGAFGDHSSCQLHQTLSRKTLAFLHHFITFFVLQKTITTFPLHLPLCVHLSFAPVIVPALIFSWPPTSTSATAPPNKDTTSQNGKSKCKSAILISLPSTCVTKLRARSFPINIERLSEMCQIDFHEFEICLFHSLSFPWSFYSTGASHHTN